MIKSVLAWQIRKYINDIVEPKLSEATTKKQKANERNEGRVSESESERRGEREDQEE